LETNDIVRFADEWVGQRRFFIRHLAASPSDETLRGTHRARWIENRLILCGVTDEHASIRRERDDGRDRSCSVYRDDARHVAIHHGENGIRRSEINADDSTH
jgi:hypothetical protein